VERDEFAGTVTGAPQGLADVALTGRVDRSGRDRVAERGHQLLPCATPWRGVPDRSGGRRNGGRFGSRNGVPGPVPDPFRLQVNRGVTLGRNGGVPPRSGDLRNGG